MTSFHTNHHIVLVGGDDINYRSFNNTNSDYSILQLKGAVGEHQRKLSRRIHEVRDFSYSELAPCIKQLHQDRKIDYIYSFFEGSVFQSAIIAKEIGVKGLDVLSCDLSINKSKLRAHLYGSDFSIPYMSCDSVGDATFFMGECKSDIVLKDQSGCMSENVYICSSNEDVKAAFSVMKHNGVGHILAEQRLVGKEYSVETLSINGVHTIFGVTEKHPYKDKLFEKCQVFPAPHLSPDSLMEITAYIERLLDKIEHRHGPTHIEIMMSGDRIQLVEINNRIGGDLIWLLVESVTGVDMLRETVLSAINADSTFQYKNPQGAYPIAACRALFGKFDIDKFTKTLPVNIVQLRTSCWDDYQPKEFIDRASDRYGYIAVGFRSMSEFHEMFDIFDDMVSHAESGVYI